MCTTLRRQNVPVMLECTNVTVTVMQVMAVMYWVSMYCKIDDSQVLDCMLLRRVFILCYLLILLKSTKANCASVYVLLEMLTILICCISNELCQMELHLVVHLT